MFVNALSYVCIIFVITIVTCKISNICIIFLLSCKLSLNLRRLMRSEATLSLTLENVIVRGSFARIFAGFIALKICLALYSEIFYCLERKIFNFFSSLSLSLIFFDLGWSDQIESEKLIFAGDSSSDDDEDDDDGDDNERNEELEEGEKMSGKYSYMKVSSWFLSVFNWLNVVCSNLTSHIDAVLHYWLPKYIFWWE